MKKIYTIEYLSYQITISIPFSLPTVEVLFDTHEQVPIKNKISRTRIDLYYRIVIGWFTLTLISFLNPVEGYFFIRRMD